MNRLTDAYLDEMEYHLTEAIQNGDVGGARGIIASVRSHDLIKEADAMQNKLNAWIDADFGTDV